MSKGLTIKQTAEVLGISPTAVWYRIQKKTLDSYVAECGRCVMVNREKVEKLLKDKTQKDLNRLAKTESILKGKK